MNVPRVLQIARICWMTACCVPSLVLIALWWRSYLWADISYVKLSATPIEVLSVAGRIKITRVGGSRNLSPRPARFQIDKPQADTIFRHLRHFDNKFGIGIVHGQNPAMLLTYWFILLFVVPLSLAAALVRWSKRFRLRTLFFAMTATAILTSVIAWWLR